MNTAPTSSITLADNETIIKDWMYATTSDSVTSSHYLLVTNKRIISTSDYAYKNGQSSTRQEMKRSDVASIACSYSNQNFKLAAIICFIFMAGFVFLALAFSALLFILAATLLIIGIVLLLKKNNYMTLVITSRARNNTVFGIYANAGVKLKNKNAKLKVKVDSSVASEIVSLIGSLVLVD